MNIPLLKAGAQDEKEKVTAIVVAEDEKKNVGKMLENSTFVLEADWLSDKYGNRVSVSSMINFIKIDEKEGVIQVGSNQSLGRNGVGGVTAEGNLTQYEVKKLGKDKGYFVNMTVMTNIGTYDISMNISSNGSTRATLSGLGSGRLYFDGYLYSPENSQVYQGTSY